MRLKTLNGAPLCEYLDFDESSLLDVDDCDEFHSPAYHASSEDSTAALKWRRLTSKHTRLRTGWSQPYLPASNLHHTQPHLSFSIPNIEDATNIDTTATFDEQPSEIDGLLRHSFIFHDTLLSSQVVPDTGAEDTISSSSFLTTSFGTTVSGLSGPSVVDGNNVALHVPPMMVVTSLGSLPSAPHLHSIYPQTPARNLLCVLMSNPERREVFVRKGGYKMNLWEVTVADDTHSSFKVTFWIRPPRESNDVQTNAQNLLLQTLEQVKVGDILLLRNIALTSFRDTVYGQSLHPAITRARTTIDILMRGSGVSMGQVGGLPATIAETFMRVKRWARTHVAPDHGSRKRKATSTKGDKHAKRVFSNPEPEETLPPDTMESV
ncbi:uncharacterized protein K460DRAFT_103291 [Cucurbitaria berberidis CBS 394.84]|uniref:Uncharacterized protein n=1 Tax=Cucurbitaria berberidis CBS 394.84 TaxID=1168544 RepID=A0A9P4GGV4_9PLEO|nr:uncharacterized protein K460DRAFT_103291 [Cucurbitaria berberidis CBS 394.84]KAF1845112.1 hypothetical protein K460DRAFT_103291 [Cucurbitaria berberidis CBS 394.84]